MRNGMRLGTALLIAGLLMSCTASDDNPEWEGSSIPQCFYDQPIYYQPTQELQPAEKVGNNIPLYYVRNEQFFIKHPKGRQGDVVPRTAVFASADGGSRWAKNGYYGIEQGYYLYQATGDGRYWIRFVGPGFAPTEVPPFQPHQIYIVDTKPPAVTLTVSPGPWEDDERKVPHIYRVGDEITLHWNVDDPYMKHESVRMSTCFAQFPHNLVWSRFENVLPQAGTMTVTIPPEAANQAGLRFRVEAKDKAGNIGIGMTPVMLVSSMAPGESASPAMAGRPRVRSARPAGQRSAIAAVPVPLESAPRAQQAQPQAPAGPNVQITRGPVPAKPGPTGQAPAEPRAEDVVPRQPSQIVPQRPPARSKRQAEPAYPYTIAPQQEPEQASVFRGPVLPQANANTKQAVVPRDNRIYQIEQRRAELAARRNEQIAQRKDGLVPPADLLEPIVVDPASAAQGQPTPPVPDAPDLVSRPEIVEPDIEEQVDAKGPALAEPVVAKPNESVAQAEPVEPRLDSTPAPVDPAETWIEQPQPDQKVAATPVEPSPAEPTSAKPAKTPAPGVTPLAVLERRQKEEIEQFRKAALAAGSTPSQRDVDLARALRDKDSAKSDRPAPAPREPLAAVAPQVNVIPAPSTKLVVNESEPQVATEVAPASPKIARHETARLDEPTHSAPTLAVPEPKKLTRPTEPLGQPSPVVPRPEEDDGAPHVEPQIALADKPGVNPPRASQIRDLARSKQLATPHKGKSTVHLKPLPKADPTAEARTPTPAEQARAPKPVEPSVVAQRPSPARPKRNPLKLEPIDTPRSQPETMGQAPRVNARNYAPQDPSAVPALGAIPTDEQPEEPEPLAIEVDQADDHRASRTARDVAINPGDRTQRGDTPSPVRSPTPIARLSDIPESVQQGWPEAGMVLRGGLSRLLNWIPPHRGSYDMIELQFSSDDGDRWTTMARDLRKGVATNWTVPMVNSTQCRLRVVGINKDRRPKELGLSPRFAVETGTWKTIDLSGFKAEVKPNQ